MTFEGGKYVKGNKKRGNLDNKRKDTGKVWE
jgi:hypothetical protein